MDDFDSLIQDAERLPFRGWDFGPLGDRWESRGQPPWDLPAIFREHLRTASALLDIGTGGGEFLSTFAPLPPSTYATEAFAPNVGIARARLEPLGVRVLSMREDQRIDLPANSVDLVLDRHESFDPKEVARVLRPDGTFITQQVGGRNQEDLHRRFGVKPELAYNRVDSIHDLAEEVAASGLHIDVARECTYPERFHDVGAVVYFLRAAPWEVPGFSVKRFRPILEDIHSEIERRGYWELTAHRLLLVATKKQAGN